jgi:hypothetical protein
MDWMDFNEGLSPSEDFLGFYNILFITFISTRVFIGLEACSYNCRETRKISRVTRAVIEKKCDNISSDNQIKEPQDKKWISV